MEKTYEKKPQIFFKKMRRYILKPIKMGYPLAYCLKEFQKLTDYLLTSMVQ